MSLLSLLKRRPESDISVDPGLGAAFAAFAAQCDALSRSTLLSEPERCTSVAGLLAPLLITASWIPADLTVPAQSEYRRECLYEAQDGACSIGVFTWEAGHMSRIHDHHGWAVMGNVTGVLRSENFLALHPGTAFKHAPDDVLHPGQAIWSTRETGDLHRISVASEAKSTSIHVYGCPFNAVNREYYTEILPPS